MSEEQEETEYMCQKKMMILLKVSRAKHNNHRDSYVDIVGYVECADQLLGKEHGAN